MALVVKELTDELEKQIEEKCKKNGYSVLFQSFDVVIDDERDVMFIPGGERGTQDEPCSLKMFCGKTRSRIIYEKRLMGQLIIHDVVKISGIPQEIGRDEMFGLISDYFECYTAHHNTIFLKNNRHSEAYEARVVFDRCEIYEK